MVELMSYNIGKANFPIETVDNVEYFIIKRSQIKDLAVGLLNYPVELNWAKIPSKLKCFGEWGVLGKGWVYEYISTKSHKIEDHSIIEWILDKYAAADIVPYGRYLVREV